MPTEDDLVHELADLVRLGRDASSAAVAEHVVKALRSAGADVEIVAGEEGRPGIFASFGTPRIVFSGHLDVVPPGDGWPAGVDPFEPALRDGELWARGTVDMKGAVAAMLALARERPPDAGFAFTTDEETRMSTAVALTRAGVLKDARLVVVGEPTSLRLGIAQKGIVWLHLRTRGKSAHASMPGEGVNAIERMLVLLAALRAFRVPETHPLTGGGTVNLGTVSGGSRPNVVPDLCEASVDVRYPPVVAPEEVVRRARRALDGAAVPYELVVDVDHHAIALPPDAPEVRLVASAVQRVTGREPELIGVPYGTDGCKFAAARVPIVTLGPGRRELAHSAAERIDPAELLPAYRAYRAIHEAFAARGGRGR